MKRILHKILEFFRTYSLRKTVFIILILGCTVALVAYRHILLENAKWFLEHHRDYLVFVIPGAIALGFYHAATGKANDQTLYLFKFLGPILASPLTCLTYAVVINTSLTLMYLVCYDGQTLQRYDTIDKITLVYTLLILITWAMFGIVKIFLEAVKHEKKVEASEITQGAPDDANTDNDSEPQS
jgi:hypothetical protein